MGNYVQKVNLTLVQKTSQTQFEFSEQISFHQNLHYITTLINN